MKKLALTLLIALVAATLTAPATASELSKQEEYGCKVKLCKSTPKPPKECKKILRKARRDAAHGRPIPHCPTNNE